MINLTFKNRDGLNISASLHPSHNKQSDIYAIFAHCFTCGKNINAAKNIANQLANNGINILRFDFTGVGESQGSVEDAYFTSNVSDLVDAARFLNENYVAPSLLIGHSLGGTATLVAALELPSVKAVATIGAPAHTRHLLSTIGADTTKIADDGEHIVDFYGSRLTINQQFIDDLSTKHLGERLADLDKALLIMHSPIDETVSISHAGELFQLAQHPKSFVSLNKSDHLLSNKQDAAYVANLIFEWSTQYLEKIEAYDFPKSKPNEITASLDLDDTYLTRTSLGKHHLLVDEPKSIGGSNLGATPTQLLAASLASCTTITLSMYASRKKFDVLNISCKVTHETVNGQSQFNRAIELSGNLTQEQKVRMLAIANKCPIHKLLTHKNIVKSYLV
ncbi:MAG: OsmC family protein [Rhizobiales bacterium]|nr:OsmC family protein [Hyphomicrobiales bacterium]